MSSCLFFPTFYAVLPFYQSLSQSLTIFCLYSHMFLFSVSGRLWELGDRKCLLCDRLSYLQCKTKHYLNFRYFIISIFQLIWNVPLNPTHYTDSCVFYSHLQTVFFREMTSTGDWIITLNKTVILNLRRRKRELQGVQPLWEVLYMGIWAFVWKKFHSLHQKFPPKSWPPPTPRHWPTAKKLNKIFG